MVEREVLIEASQACDLLIERVRGRAAAPTPQSGAELGHFAAAALEAYYDTLLRALIAAASRRAAEDADQWVRQQFHAGLDRAGTALREAVAESPHPHTDAPKLQQKMFHGEASLRRALSAHFDGVVLPGAATSARGRARQRKAAG